MPCHDHGCFEYPPLLLPPLAIQCLFLPPNQNLSDDYHHHHYHHHHYFVRPVVLDNFDQPHCLSTMNHDPANHPKNCRLFYTQRKTSMFPDLWKMTTKNHAPPFEIPDTQWMVLEVHRPMPRCQIVDPVVYLILTWVFSAMNWKNMKWRSERMSKRAMTKKTFFFWASWKKETKNLPRVFPMIQGVGGEDGVGVGVWRLFYWIDLHFCLLCLLLCDCCNDLSFSFSFYFFSLFFSCW